MLPDYSKSLPRPDCLTLKVDFNTINPLQIAQSLGRITTIPEKRLLITCENLTCVRELGVSYFVSVLLQIRSCGVTPILQRVPPSLERALRLLKLDALFSIGSL